MGKFINIVGERYGRLVVESLSRKVRRVGTGVYDYYWNCICDCGNRIEVLGKSLSCKNRESCGCLHRERISKSRKGNPVKYKHIPLFDSEKEALDYIYKITDDGRVFSRCDGKELTVVNGPKGYKYIRLKNPQFSKHKDGRKSYKVHRLVAMFYLKQYSEKLFVNHKNGDKTDNRVQNLEMVTNRENVIHAWNQLDTEARKRRLSESLKKFYATHSVVIPHERDDSKRGKALQISGGKIIRRHHSVLEASK